MLDETFTQLNGLNLYAYCYNNPVMMTDPDGAFALTWWQKLLIGLAFITLGAIVRIKEPGPVWSVGTASKTIRAVKGRKRSDLGAVC